MGDTFTSLAARCPFFESLDPSVLDRLALGVRRSSLTKGRVLFIENDRPDAAYLVETGLVRIFVTELDGTETTIRIVRDGELFGELAVVDGGVRAASAMALRPTTAYRVPADLLDRELPPPGSIGRSLLRGLVAMVRDDTRRLVIERSQRLESAVARALTDDPGVLRRINQGELASLLGVSRQSLNQTLRTWERDGLIDRADGRMRLTDLDALRQRYLIG